MTQDEGVRAASDQRFMAAALSLSARHLGLSSPNPTVGALVVRDGVIVGRGVTAPGGRPHAERLALEQAGPLAEGATLYVTLEPCARRSQSRDATACTDLVIAGGIGRVVIGAEDPSPHANREGLKRFAQAGIAVTRHVLAEACGALNRGHILRVTADRPLVELKLALTQDGFAGTLDRRPLAITGEAARARTHIMRAEADAIMVGIGTVLADDPDLTCRLPGIEDRSPVRVVLDKALRLPPTSRLTQTARDVPVWLIAAVDAPVERERALRMAGIEVMRVGEGANHHLDLAAILALLSARGVTRLMVEGGPMLADSLAEAGFIDRFMILRAAKPLGQPGLPGIRPGLMRWLRRARLVHAMDLPGDDRASLYERT
jgi:diaminohydroxyphosphoribosylaminopyrimidine deaminase / 5-amino-6-(5-phosphoribosylamino)uracil reductase